MPTLVIAGKYDGAIGPEQMRTLAARLPNAHFDEFDQSAHFVYAEQPVKFLRDVEHFSGFRQIAPKVPTQWPMTGVRRVCEN